MKRSSRQMLSPAALQLVAARFKVLSDPLRLRILQNLEAGETSVSALTEALAATQPNVSKHLKIMQDAGLLTRRQEGNTVYYAIADPTVFDLCEVVCASLQERFAAHASAFVAAAPAAVRRRRG